MSGADAWTRARRLYPNRSSRRNPYQGIYVAGFLARQAGRPETACPYPREVATTWNTARRRAWQRGWQSG